MEDRLSLFLFVFCVLIGAFSIASLTVPGEWYASLQKPVFFPADWIFLPVWIVVHAMIGVSGWRVWRLEHDGPAMVSWWVQLTLIFIWPAVFFVARNFTLALLIILALLAAILAFIALAWRLDRPAALLFLPYAAWVAFAALLNASIWSLN